MADSILEYDNAVDEILAHPDTPTVVAEQLARVDVHDNRADGVRISKAKESAKNPRRARQHRPTSRDH